MFQKMFLPPCGQTPRLTNRQELRGGEQQVGSFNGRGGGDMRGKEVGSPTAMLDSLY